LADVARADGVIVGSCLRDGGRAGGPVNRDLAGILAATFRAARPA
jgi:predicted TIM-barrel enzyme